MKDKKIERLIKLEEERQRNTLGLIASENFVSPDVLRAEASFFIHKYAEGYPGKRYYAGAKIAVDPLENLVKERALKLYGLSPKEWAVNAQALSGVSANIFAYRALADFGEKMMAQALDQGGHLSHGSPVSMTSKLWRWVHYQVDPSTHLLDYDVITHEAVKEKPKVLVAGTSAYSRVIDFKKFRKAADASGALLMVDMAHIAGLVAGRVHPSPFPYADIVTTTTHKTLRGPRGALIICRKELEGAVNKAVFPGGQGGPHMNSIAAIAVALFEASRPEFKKYSAQVVKNAHALAGRLMSLGFKIITDGTDNHLMVVDLSRFGLSGGEAQNMLEGVGIVANKNTIPNDIRQPMDPSGIRFGTPGLTTRGMREKEMILIASMIHEVIIGRKKNLVKIKVRNLCKKFPIK
ncbi:MAG: serine hydroxymethyltransferase [Candidatus Niyogibacteria bacterium CG10_big_fil_rev_8_21_14_0_10_42_19]|uniref:Serine hydroxymethyltransferase n=1 Tax=Candidatus Niyogibacteria bacterium CG10_big_fil_rev_8_21_14_0_10_42_19 TaxID=1974725 RepID=A0A2H0TIL4_9BACT|nr:MAG: serine hydroxymethyltransferase [Candidatus Niyogibacteria bacterium CG10_big_fil_rev_8_21_14_0_10_42_19]